jgi:hypothetical protein
MRIIIRGKAGVHLLSFQEPAEWTQLQDFAKQAGWKPALANYSPEDGSPVIVGAEDAQSFLKALARHITPQPDPNQPSHVLIGKVIEGLEGTIANGFTLETIPFLPGA